MASTYDYWDDVRKKYVCGQCYASEDDFAEKDAEIARLKAEIQDANGALDDASVRRNDADSIACGIETLAKQRDDLADLWSDIGDIFWPEREKDDGYSDTAIREAVNEMNSEIARLKERLRAVVHVLNEVMPLDGPQNAEDVAREAVALIARLKAAGAALRKALVCFNIRRHPRTSLSRDESERVVGEWDRIVGGQVEEVK